MVYVVIWDVHDGGGGGDVPTCTGGKKRVMATDGAIVSCEPPTMGAGKEEQQVLLITERAISN